MCGGPGGFTQYVLWRTYNKANGFGITLKENDFRIPPGYPFKAFCGAKESGNSLDPDNIKTFVTFINRHTNNIG